MSDHYLQYQIANFQESARMLLGVGAVVALIGLVTPWFLDNPPSDWSSGWSLMTNDNLGWIGVIAFAYLLVLVLAVRFPARWAPAPAAVAVLATFAVLASLFALATGVADARADARGGLERMGFNAGLWLLLAGGAAVQVGALATWALYTLEALLGIERASAPPEPRH